MTKCNQTVGNASFLLFLHTPSKGLKRPLKTPRLPTPQGALPNAACGNHNPRVRRLQFPAAVSSAFPLEKVGKNAMKWPILLSTVVTSAKSAKPRGLQGLDSQRAFVLSAFLRKNDPNHRQEPFRRNLSVYRKRPCKQNRIFAYIL